MLPLFSGVGHSVFWLPVGAQGGLCAPEVVQNLGVPEEFQSAICFDLEGFRGGLRDAVEDEAAQGSFFVVAFVLADGEQLHLSACGEGVFVGEEDSAVFVGLGGGAKSAAHSLVGGCVDGLRGDALQIDGLSAHVDGLSREVCIRVHLLDADLGFGGVGEQLFQVADLRGEAPVSEGVEDSGGGFEGEGDASDGAPSLAVVSPVDRGFYLSGHPFKRDAGDVERFRVIVEEVCGPSVSFVGVAPSKALHLHTHNKVLSSAPG